MRPTFLGIGAHKAGTSWLHRELERHPHVWVPPVKELHFFDRSPRYPSPNTLATASPGARLLGSQPWERPRMMTGLRKMARQALARDFRRAAWEARWTLGYYDEAWYRGLFAQGSSHGATGEITPSYSILEERDVERIKALNPAMKLLFVVRDPIERAWSAIRASVSRGLSSVDIESEDEIIAEMRSRRHALRGDYERTLDIYLRHFDPAQILVCFHGAIQRDPVGLLGSVSRFLGVPPPPPETIDHRTRVNRSPPRPMPPRIRDELLRTHLPMIERLSRSWGGYARRWAHSPDDDGASWDDESATRPPPTLHP